MDGIFVVDGEVRVESVVVVGFFEVGLVLGFFIVVLVGRGLEVVEEDVFVRDVFNFFVFVVLRFFFFFVRDLEVVVLLVVVLFVVFEFLVGFLFEFVGLGCFLLVIFLVFFILVFVFFLGGGGDGNFIGFF